MRVTAPAFTHLRVGVNETPYSTSLHARLMTPAAGRRPLLRSAVTSNTAIVKSPFGHHLVKVAVLGISRVAFFSMMANIALVQLRYAADAYAVVASRTGGTLFCRKRRIRVRAYELFVALVIVEDYAAPSLLVQPENFRRKSAGCLLRLTGRKHTCTQSGGYRQAKRVCDNNSQLQFHSNSSP